MKLYYALPATSMAMLWTPLNVMQGIYIKHYGFAMATMALILLASRVYDAVADLAVGGISDWLKAKTGRRKPLFAAGAVLFAVTGAFVYIPPASVSPMYLAFWLFAFFTGYATVYVSHLAWGAELAPGSRQKTELFGFRTAAGYAGLCLFYSMPLLPIFESSEITPQTIRIAVLVSLTWMVVSLALCLKNVPEGTTTERPGGHSVVSLASLRAVAANRPFVVLMAAYVLAGAGLGVWYGMIFIYVDIYLKRGALFAPLYLLAFAVGVSSAFAWNRFAARFGKKAAWSVGTLLALATAVAMPFLTPANADAWTIGAILILNTIGLVSFELLPGSILGDVADYSLLKNGRNQTGTYFSVYMFVTKVLFALGGAIGLGLASWLGFEPTAANQSPAGTFALTVAMAWVPGALLTAAVIAIPFIPMNERRHAIVRRRLAQRA
jgi:Na+/melibiose symporter-like transporter